MTTRYVGPGGSDGSDGLSWANRKLTLTGVEDTPVAANDTVYVGPGVYRETLTVDVSGSSGNPITYIGDVTGENTDGVGGIVRVTGSNDDQTATRTYCVTGTSKDYRTFRGFAFDMATVYQIYAVTSCDGWIIEDCYFGGVIDDADNAVRLDCTASDLFTVRRCVVTPPAYGVRLFSASELSVDSSSVIENCVFLGGAGANGIGIESTGAPVGFKIKNCLILSCSYGVHLATATTGTFDVNNCAFDNNQQALRAQATGDIVEDYNAVPGSNQTPRSNVATGSNSNAYPILSEMPQLLDGSQFPWNMFAPSKWSQIARIAGTGESTDDLYGVTRPTTSAKKSWGAVQYQPGTRETTTTRGSSTASIAFADAGAHQIFVPVTAVSTTIEVYTYFETNHTGTKPQMIIKEPGQSDRTTTDTGSADTWNQLTDTFTPQSTSDYVVVELRSNNTATSGSYAVYFDDLSVS
jgi:hypothetical protein